MDLMKSVIAGILLVSFALMANGQPLPDAPRDEAYDKITLDDKGIIPYDPLREADIFYKKRIWRVIETSEKINLSFKYPKQYFVDILRDHAIEGTLTAYDGMDDEFTTPIAPGDVEKVGVGEADTLYIVDPVTLKEEMEIAPALFDPEKVKKFRLKEDWIFDEETSTLLVRILGIAPILEVVDDQGNVRGDQVMFWIYYPEARPILAKYQVYNPKNDAATISWEDLFELRFFGSYIMKESNVYDRRIQDYAIGVDALWESERITNEIFDFEQSLWSY